MAALKRTLENARAGRDVRTPAETEEEEAAVSKR